MRNYYLVLGVPRSADATRIRDAYRALVKRHHPDHSTEPHAAGRLRDVVEAYAVLSDPARRQCYDRTLPPEHPAPTASPRSARVQPIPGVPRVLDLAAAAEALGARDRSTIDLSHAGAARHSPVPEDLRAPGGAWGLRRRR